MKTTLFWFLAASAIGAAAGVALGYWEASPWLMPASDGTAAKPDAESKGEAPATSPQADIGETTFNFDKMESGSTQRHAFPIRNVGQAPLDLEFVSHTCKCTSVELDGKPVEPGAAVVVAPGNTLEVTLEWAAKVAPGPFRHGATFTTNDPSRSRVELQIEGDVVDSTTLQPTMLNFHSVDVGSVGRSEMIVMSFLEPTVEILSHEVVDDQLAKQVTISVEPLEKADLPEPDALAGAKIIASYAPGKTIGPFGGSLKIKTNLQRAPNLEVPIYGSVKGDISIFGKGWSEPTGTLRLSPADSATGTSTRLNVSLRGDQAKETKLTVASVKPPELKATLGKPRIIRDNLVQVPLTVEIPPGTRPMVMAGEDQGGEGEIILSTNRSETSEVRLRVTFTVKP